MSVLSIVTVAFLVMAIGVLPLWSRRAGWGYYPSGGFGLVVIALLILAFTGRI